MTSTAPSTAASPLPPRSATVTALAWGVMIVSALLTPISVISLLMIIAGSYGTSTFDPLGFLTVVVAPPASLVAGVGLLRRKRWAYFYMVVLFAVVLAFQIYETFRRPSPPSTHVSPEGVRTTVYHDGGYYSVPIIAACIGSLVLLLSPRVRLEFSPARAPARPQSASPQPRGTAPSSDGRGWRVGHVGRDFMYYEEWRDGTWHRIDIEGEMLTGRAHHAVYFASPERWLAYPEWARHRRDEIIARIKSELREPDYEYQLAGVVPSLGRAPAAPSRPSQRLAALFAAALLLALAGGMAWLVYDGTTSGETVLPSQRASQRRSVSRHDEPALFWVSIAIYAAIGLGGVGLVGWGVAATRRHR